MRQDTNWRFCRAAGFSTAAETYAELLKSNPAGDTATSAAYERALALFKLGRFKEAIEQGMMTLRQDGLEKVRAGLTSIEEVVRVIV